MKNWQDWVWRALLGLIVVFILGEILSAAITFVSLASQPLGNLVFCPLGKVAKYNPDPFDKDTEEFEVACYDQKGVSVAAFPLTSLWSLERNYFRKPSYFLVAILLAAWYSRNLIRQWIQSKNSLGV